MTENKGPILICYGLLGNSNESEVRSANHRKKHVDS